MIACVQALAEILDNSVSVATLRRGIFMSKMIQIIYICKSNL